MNADAVLTQIHAQLSRKRELAKACHSWGVRNQPQKYYRNFTGGWTRYPAPPTSGDPRWPATPSS